MDFRVAFKPFRRRPGRRDTANADDDLERFFTDAEDARARFQKLVNAVALPKRILVVHGVGAVGKSSLLRMYRLFCRRNGVPVALVEEVPAAVGLLDRWEADLRAAGVDLPALESGLARYHALQAKVEAEVRNVGEAEASAADALTKAAAKGTVAAASAIPIAGPVVAAAGSEPIEAVLNLLRKSLSRPELSFYLDPTSRLTDDFLADLGSAAERRRIVLMLDAYERVTALDEWLCDLVARMPENVLVVIAGRVVPDWDRVWPGWVGRAELIELTEMSDEDAAELVRRYFALFDRGEPDPEQVDQVVAFARGLPLAATTAVRLWANHQLSDMKPLGSGVVAELADRLLDGVPAETRPAFEAAALLRSFNADSLAALLDANDARALFDELRRWPFTRPTGAGFAVHDSMRQVIDAALRASSPDQFRRLHDKAAAYHAERLDQARGDERERLQLEWLYHSVCADETAGSGAFQELAEELVRSQWMSRLRVLLNDAASYPLEREASRLWRRYYRARLEQLEGRLADAEREYRAIAGDETADRKLRAYAWCDLGAILAAFERLSESDGERRAVEAASRSLEFHPELDAKLASNHVTLMNVSNARADWDESTRHLSALREHAERRGDDAALVTTDLLQAAVYGLQGDWRGYLETRERYRAALDRLGDVPVLAMQAAYFTWPLVFMGRCSEALESSERAVELALRVEERELMITILESVALAHGMQDAFAEAAERFGEAANFYDNVHAPDAGAGGAMPERYIRAMLSFRGLVALREGRLDDADADLARALEIKRKIGDLIGTPELHAWRGRLYEVGGNEDAAAEYERVLELRGLSRNYFEASALAGLARVHAGAGRYTDCAEALAAAEAIADRYEYNDLRAELALLRAHLAWDGLLAGEEGGPDAATALYRRALVHGLRFNRFLLDELLLGPVRASVVQAVVPRSRERGADGRRVLESLHRWWRTDANDLDNRPAVVSPLKAGLPLVDAERIARSREPGVGGTQRTVLEQLGAALEDD